MIFSYLIPTLVCSSLLASCAGSKPTRQMKPEILAGRAVNPTSPRVARNASLIKQQLHEGINRYRISKGLEPLSHNAMLSSASRDHSSYMKDASVRANKRMVISHDHFSARMNDIKQLGGPPRLAENVAANSGLAEEFVAETIVQGWVDSKGHHKNLTGNYNSVGTGIVIGPNNTVFATQIFGGR